MDINRIGREVSVLSDQQEVPGIGFIPVNAFVLHAAEPVVVDTGLSMPDRGCSPPSNRQPKRLATAAVDDRHNSGALRAVNRVGLSRG